jgi:hypothetical protein
MAKKPNPKNDKGPVLNVHDERYFCDRALIAFSDEHFVLGLQTGTALHHYAFTPKHMKRLMLLLADKIAEHEKQYGKLTTSLPKPNGKA